MWSMPNVSCVGQQGERIGEDSTDDFGDHVAADQHQRDQQPFLVAFAPVAVVVCVSVIMLHLRVIPGSQVMHPVSVCRILSVWNRISFGYLDSVPAARVDRARLGGGGPLENARAAGGLTPCSTSAPEFPHPIPFDCTGT